MALPYITPLTPVELREAGIPEPWAFGLQDRVRFNEIDMLGHVNKFSDYCYDWEELIKFGRENECTTPYVLFAHSMGGAIGLKALFDREDVSCAIFSAPLWGLYIEGWRRKILKIYIDTIGRLAEGTKRLPTMPDRNASIIDGFEGNNLTNNLEEFRFRKEQLTRHPDLELAGPTIRWVVEAVRTCAANNRRKDPGVPMLCLLGANETIVSNRTCKRQAKKWSSLNCIEYADAQHELLIETPDTQKKLWSDIESFLSSHVG